MMKKNIFLILLLTCVTIVTGCVNPNVEESDSSQSPQIQYKELRVDASLDMYDYDDMVYDIHTIKEAYPNLVTPQVIGKTADDRDIYDIIIGDTNADKHIIIHGGIHAREYMTSKLVAKQAAYYLYHLNNGSGEYKGVSYDELFNGICVHLIPMVNPDGITLSQYGVGKINSPDVIAGIEEIVKSEDGELSNYDFRLWKANASGVDINRNFDAMWQEYVGAGHPSSALYKGVSPASEPESKALVDITTRNNVIRTISYHAMGEVIYWYFGQSGELYDITNSFANEIAAVTGYLPDDDFAKLDAAGYKDWAIDKLKIPSITIEIGHGQIPVAEEQFNNIWIQNKDVVAATLYNMKMGD